MPQYQDESHLQEAIRTTLAQLCKVSMVYQSDLCIAGTIGLTIDKKKVVLIHFDEKVCSLEAQVESSQTTVQTITQPTVSSQAQPATDTDVCNLRLLGAEALSSLHEYLSRPLVSQTNDPNMSNNKQRAGLEDTSGKMLTLNETIAIDLDSDSESFSGMAFDDMEEVKVKGGLLGNRHTDVKNIIVIDDNDLFDSGADPMDSAYTQDSYGAMTESLRNSFPQQSCSSDPSALDHSVTTDLPTDSALTTRRNSFEDSALEESPSPLPSKPTFNCEECSKTLPSQSLLEAHLVGTHDMTETPALGKITHYTCTHCGKKFRFQTALHKHESKHVRSKPHKCRLCPNAYSYRTSLDIHTKIHSNSLSCHLCNKVYNNKKLFQKHIVYMHDNPQHSFKKTDQSNQSKP